MAVSLLALLCFVLIGALAAAVAGVFMLVEENEKRMTILMVGLAVLTIGCLILAGVGAIGTNFF